MQTSHQLLAAAFVLASSMTPLAEPADDLPRYPGAAKSSHQMTQPVPATCGHKLLLVSYDTKDDPNKVAAWYESRVPGATTFREQNDPNQTAITVFDADGARVAVITRMHFANEKLQASAASIGMDTTGLGLGRYDPPLGRAYLDLERQVRSNPAQANALRAKFASMCPNG